MASGGIPIKLFLVYPPRKTYFDIFLSVNPKTLFLMKRVFFLKKVYPKLEKRGSLYMCTHFISQIYFYKKYFP
jgi:hypothetical protein